jgi:hypothetical protein
MAGWCWLLLNKWYPSTPLKSTVCLRHRKRPEAKRVKMALRYVTFSSDFEQRLIAGERLSGA